MKTRYIILIAILGIALVSGYGIYKNNTTSGEYDEFAKCLSENDVIMYGTDWCSYCQKQKSLFGKSFDYVNYINCDSNKRKCVENNVKGYPTWKINNQTYSGVRPLESLSSMTDCKLN
ncbi:MAG TPA: thioredoxin domain-containing protein [Candidatus Nanoarchaeia archaeon]|nr:thioredoxin domain-containing protein [Candidatus Nanoarchaeia archaeon]